MKIKLKFNHWYLNNPIINPSRRWRGITLYPYILFRDSKEEVSEELFKHEMRHIYQVEQFGWVKYYLTWIYYTLRYGYKNNKYEVEARISEKMILSDTEKRIWDEA